MEHDARGKPYLPRALSERTWTLTCSSLCLGLKVADPRDRPGGFVDPVTVGREVGVSVPDV